MAAVERKGKKLPTEGTPDHFKKMLEGPSLNHDYPIKHAYKDCKLMKKFLFEGSKKGDWKKKPDLPRDDAEEKEGTFLEETGCLMIFGGLCMTSSTDRSSCA
jgi:hypothetical protein